MSRASHVSGNDLIELRPPGSPDAGFLSSGDGVILGGDAEGVDDLGVGLGRVRCQSEFGGVLGQR